ncbi:hypothetical protein An16g05110 [Aspergillus niger]|uniref:Uncharacterized protein n=2 Tax=Aspergillus niger TaxID=5061 RepID=A2R7X7_ASPNC|nr:hypothetical protein An16g05110 [Aspergillus niger]CAK97365.1 hypothetical protein An16g05110 [Aspergillus niger]
MREGVEGERTKREEVYDWMIRRGYNGLVGRRRKRPRLRGDGTECVADVEFGVLTRARNFPRVFPRMSMAMVVNPLELRDKCKVVNG